MLKGDVAMNKRIYRHKCKECETDFYIEDLRLLSIASCPKCKGQSIYVDECIVKQGRFIEGEIPANIHIPKPPKQKMNHY